MRLPKNSVIPKDKLVRYLLLARPEDDKSKFLANVGYTMANWETLEKDIRYALDTHEAVSQGVNVYGEVFQLRATWRGPNGKDVAVVTVWIQLSGTAETRFVTLFPDREVK